jgi:hypothetical protein
MIPIDENACHSTSAGAFGFLLLAALVDAQAVVMAETAEP